MRKLVRIGSNAIIPGDSHCEDKGYCSYFSKKNRNGKDCNT